MKQIALLAITIGILALSTIAQQPTVNQSLCHLSSAICHLSSVDHINPLIGTAAKGKGGTMPCVTPPYAMTNFTAQTRQNKMNTMPYVYEDSTIIGFIGTHQPTVWMGDYGYISVMPQTGDLKVTPQDRKLAFSHADEVAKAYYYSVKLQTGGRQILSEMTATERCGILRFTFPQGAQQRIIIQGIYVDPANDDYHNKSNKRSQLKGYIIVDTARREIRGYNPDRTAMNLGPDLPNFKGYFIVRFNQPIQGFGVWNKQESKPGNKELNGSQTGAWVEFRKGSTATAMVKIATSFISMEQAVQNMQYEIPAWDFDRVVRSTKNKWQQQMNRVQLTAVSDEQRAIFYTSLYHSLLFPRELSEYGRYYSGFDDKVHDGQSYTDFSLWDTFRALHPLLVFTQPERINDMIKAMLQMYQQGGWLPMWPNPAETNIMIGTHADAVIADAYVKGFRGYDVPLAYEAMLKNATVPPVNDTSRKGMNRAEWVGYEVRSGLSYYNTIGYVPADKMTESVSRTLEYALDDYCIARVAQALNKKADYERLMKQSRNYKNVFNSATGFMAPRLVNGNWGGDEKLAFTEGSPWTYLFCVMQDIPGLMELMGGKQQFLRMLDRNFNEGHYAHNNEPGHHYAYLYNYAGQPWKTQELVRQISRNNYFNQPEGMTGNEDCGQMSAWYIFSTMGFYPVTPASGIYAIGAPQCPALTIQFPSGNTTRSLKMVAEDFSEANKYVAAVYWNGEKLKDPFISHQALAKGGTLLFKMSSTPVAVTQPPVQLMAAPGTIADNSVTLLWQKPALYANIKQYRIFLNGKEIGVADKCNYTINNLKPATSYTVSVATEANNGEMSVASNNINLVTRAASTIINIFDYGAKADSTTLNTVAIQQAIDQCPTGGTVIIPRGIFLSGALHLKGNMTLYIAAGGVLKGSANPDHYLPMIPNRFEGWEMETYASLLNAGTLCRDGSYNVENLSVKGEGTIRGGGIPLGKAMIAQKGMRGRGRLICFMNCRNVEIAGLQVLDPPCWTIHYIYSNNITCRDLNIVSTAENGDGIDPDSSTDCYIFNCRFSNGDDCIAIKSGKNPEGYAVGKPTVNVQITSCDFVEGHGISIGSEISGGIKDILVRDCKAGNLINGLQIKGTKERGGIVENVVVKDCYLRKIFILTKLPYNNDGEAAPEMPLFRNFHFSNINMTESAPNQNIIKVNGFSDPTHYTSNIRFEEMVLPAQSIVSISNCTAVNFTNVVTATGAKPVYKVNESTHIQY